MKLFLRICAVVFVGLSASHAGAQTLVEVAARWGLLGTWMIDCVQPPAVNNPRDTYVAKQGQLLIERDLGPRYPQVPVPITAAILQPDGNIEISEYYANVNPPQTRRTTITKKGNGRIRVVSNVNANTGEYSVRNGTLIHTGMPTRWQARCR